MEHKFQWSMTVNGEMIVIRTDDKDEFDKLVKEYKDAYKVGEALEDKTPENEPAPVGFGVCKKNASHGQMIMGRNGKEYCKKCYIEWKNSQGKTY